MILSRRTFDSVPVRLRLTDEEIGRFAVHRYEFPGVDLRHAPDAPLSVMASSACMRSATSAPISVAGPRAHRPRDLRRHDADRQARRSRAPTSARCTARTAIARSWSMRRAARCSARARLRPTCIRRRRSPATTWCCRSIWLRSRPPRRRSGIAAARWLRSTRATATCWRSPAGPASTRRPFARGLSRAEYAELTDDIDKPLFNRALRGTYPSGSTIKPVIALAGPDLSRGRSEPRRNSAPACSTCPAAPTCTAKARAASTATSTWSDAIAKSCDVYFYGLAATIGAEHIADFLAPFGYRPAHRHRHRRREAGPAALARVEAQGLQAPAGPDLVSGRDREFRRRPRLSAGHAAAARARGRRCWPSAARASGRAWSPACATLEGNVKPSAPVPAALDRQCQRREPGTWCCAA